MAGECQVDSEPSIYTTDADGKLTISGLANGAHEIRLLGDSYDSGSIYLDNYCGLVNPVASNAPGEIALARIDVPEEEPQPEPEPAQTGGNKVLYALIGLISLALIAVLFFTVDKWGAAL